MIKFIKCNFNAKIKIDNNFLEISPSTIFPLPANYKTITIFGEHLSHAFFVPYVLSEKFCTTYNYVKLNAQIIEIKPNYYAKRKINKLLINTPSTRVEFINNGKCFIKIFIGNNLYLEQLAGLCQSPQIFENSNYIIVCAQNFDDGYSVAVFNKAQNKFCLNTTSSQISIEQNTLSLLGFPLSIGAAECTIYNIENLNFEIKENYFVETTPFKMPTTQIGFALFEAVKSQYFSVAQKLLSPNMQQIATNAMLSEFFKDYTKIVKNPFNENSESYLLFNKTDVIDINFSLTGAMLIDNIDKN